MKLTLDGLRARAHGRKLAPLQLHLDASSPDLVKAIVFEDERTLDTLIATLSGSIRPERGSVRVAGQDPSSSPAVRARIATTYFHEPSDGLDARVVAHRREVERVRERAGALSGPSPAALVLPGDARLDELTARERRGLALELALRLVEPLALFLADPLRDLDAAEAHALLESLARHTERRAPCIFACTSRESAARLTPHIIELGYEVKS